MAKLVEITLNFPHLSLRLRHHSIHLIERIGSQRLAIETISRDPDSDAGKNSAGQSKNKRSIHSPKSDSEALNESDAEGTDAEGYSL